MMAAAAAAPGQTHQAGQTPRPERAGLVQARTCAPAEPKPAATTALTAESWAAAGSPRLRGAGGHGLGDGGPAWCPGPACGCGAGGRRDHRHSAGGGDDTGRAARAADGIGTLKHVNAKP